MIFTRTITWNFITLFWTLIGGTFPWETSESSSSGAELLPEARSGAQVWCSEVWISVLGSADLLPRRLLVEVELLGEGSVTSEPRGICVHEVDTRLSHHSSGGQGCCSSLENVSGFKKIEQLEKWNKKETVLWEGKKQKKSCLSEKLCKITCPPPPPLSALATLSTLTLQYCPDTPGLQTLDTSDTPGLQTLDTPTPGDTPGLQTLETVSGARPLYGDTLGPW